MYLEMISPTATELGRQCMMNELARYGRTKRISTKVPRKPPRNLGNAAWKALA